MFFTQFGVYINWFLNEIGFYEYNDNLPKITVYYVEESGSSLKNAYNQEGYITMKNRGFDTFAHEYGHYLSDYYDLLNLVGGSHHPNQIYIGYKKGVIYGESHTFDLVLAESFAFYFAAYCENYVRNNATFVNYLSLGENLKENDHIENINVKKEGEFLECNVYKVLWDLTDNTPEEENAFIGFIELCNSMKELNRQKESEMCNIYTLADLCDFLITNNIENKENILKILEINNITTDIIFNMNGETNNIFIEAVYFEYCKDENDYKNNIQIKHYIFDRYILNIYEKKNNQYIKLDTEFVIGNIDEERLVDIDGILYYKYEFEESLIEYIKANSFKELYFTVEQINYVEDNEIVTAYETYYQRLIYITNGLVEEQIEYVMDTNYYMQIAYKAEVTMDYNIYSEGNADVMCLLYSDVLDEESLIIGNDNKDGEDVNFFINIRLQEGEIIYLKIPFVVSGGTTVIHIEFDMDVTGYLLIDSPLYAVHGTEVTINNGEYNGLTITSGLSRIAYIPQGNWSLSRLDYEWSSSNRNVLTVSPYGTLQALKVDTDVDVIVTAVNKADPEIIFIQNLLVKADNSNEKKYININMNLDVNEGDYISLNDFCPNPILQSYSWCSSDESIAEVTYFGYVTKKQEGETIIYGTYLYNENYIIVINVS